MSFDSEYPFAANNILKRMRQNKNPGVVFQHGFILMSHYFSPYERLDSLRVISGFNIGTGIIEECLRLERAYL